MALVWMLLGVALAQDPSTAGAVPSEIYEALDFAGYLTTVVVYDAYGPDEPPDLTMGTGEPYDLRHFSAKAGDRVHLAVRSSAYQPYLILTGPQEQKYVAPSSGVLEATVTADGLYAVVISTAAPGEAGRYTGTFKATPKAVFEAEQAKAAVLARGPVVGVKSTPDPAFTKALNRIIKAWERDGFASAKGQDNGYGGFKTDLIIAGVDGWIGRDGVGGLQYNASLSSHDSRGASSSDIDRLNGLVRGAKLRCCDMVDPNMSADGNTYAFGLTTRDGKGLDVLVQRVESMGMSMGSASYRVHLRVKSR